MKKTWSCRQQFDILFSLVQGDVKYMMEDHAMKHMLELSIMFSENVLAQQSFKPLYDHATVIQHY